MSTAIRQDRPPLSGNVILAQHVHMIAKTPPACAVATSAEPRVTPIKDGDRVIGIEVVCTCGEVIRVDCVY